MSRRIAAATERVQQGFIDAAMEAFPGYLSNYTYLIKILPLDLEIYVSRGSLEHSILGSTYSSPVVHVFI